MDTKTMYDVFHSIPWGINVVFYMFLASMSAGCFFICFLGHGLGIEKYKPASKTAGGLSLILIALAPLFLLTDLEKPLQFYKLLFNFNPSSVMSWGVWLLSLYALNTLAFYICIVKENEAKAKLFGLIGVALAFTIPTYTGLLLSVNQSRPLWHSSVTPMFFLMAALLSGNALVLGVSIIKDTFAREDGKLLKHFPKLTPEAFAGFRKMHMAFVFISLFLVLLKVLVLVIGGEEIRQVTLSILFGTYAFAFWGLAIFLGAVIPLILMTVPQTKRIKAILFLTTVFVLIGAFSKKLVFVIGGYGI